MASEFEPVVRTQETPEARIVIVEVPGFRKEDLKVEIGNQGNLIISGKRGVKEMEEMTKVGGRLEKMHRFRKVISTPENLNTDGRITAKFRDEALRISLPLLHIPDQQSQAEALPGNEKPDQSVQSKVKSSSPARQQDSMQEQSGVAQDNQRARHPDAIKQDDEKTKASAAVEESKGLVAERKTEAPKLAQDFVHDEPPISKDAQELSAEAGIGDQSQFIQS